MTAKERVIAATQHRQTDIVPYHLTFTMPAREKLMAAYGDDGFEQHLGNHLAIIEALAPDAWQEIEPGHWLDEWGVVWNRTVDRDIGVPSQDVLAGPELSSLRVPDPHDPIRFARHMPFIEKYGDRFVLHDLGFGLFERAWALRGMENLLTDMCEQPAFVDELLDLLADWTLAVIDEAARYRVDGFWFGDDWGSQRGLIMGPRLWRRFIKPRYERIYRRVREYARFVFIHSCGRIEELYGDLVEMGVDVVNPFQPEVIDVRTVKRAWGDRLSFWGGVSTQQLLPYSAPAEVRSMVEGLLQDIGTGGGYICAPAHDVPGDVPVANLLMLIEVLQGQRRWSGGQGAVRMLGGTGAGVTGSE